MCVCDQIVSLILTNILLTLQLELELKITIFRLNISNNCKVQLTVSEVMSTQKLSYPSDVSAFLLPMSASHHSWSVLLCLTEIGCSDLEEQSRKVSVFLSSKASVRCD